MYAPRDPLAEYLNGRVSFRQLRVMVEHLPPGSAVHRAANGPWGDQDWVLHDVSSRLRDLLVLTSNLNRPKNAAPRHPEYLPSPQQPGDPVPVDDGPEQAQLELRALIHRGG